MTNFLYLFPLLLLFSGMMQGAAPPAPKVRLFPANSLFRQVTVATESIAPGQTQRLDIRLQKEASSQTIFKLVVIYPSGAQQEVLDSTISDHAEIEWQMPADTGVGVATFTLATTGCGCGDSASSQGPVTNTSLAEGEFQIE